MCTYYYSIFNSRTLHSIDIHTTNGLTPLTIQSENKIVECIILYI